MPNGRLPRLRFARPGTGLGAGRGVVAALLLIIVPSVGCKNGRSPVDVALDEPKTIAAADVGTAGGYVAAASGPVMSIPPGALQEEQTIVIKDSGKTASSGAPLYQFEPSGTVFEEMVQVTFPLPAGWTDGVIYWTVEGSTTQFEAIPSTVTEHGVVGYVKHFSFGYVGPVLRPPPVDDPDVMTWDVSSWDEGSWQ